MIVQYKYSIHLDHSTDTSRFRRLIAPSLLYMTNPSPNSLASSIHFIARISRDISSSLIIIITKVASIGDQQNARPISATLQTAAFIFLVDKHVSRFQRSSPSASSPVFRSI